MIKSISILTRKENLTHEQFVRHWVEIHAPLAHAVPGLERYVQSHIVEQRFRSDIAPLEVQLDGIAELWFASLEDMRAANASAQMKALHDDGARFIGRIATYTVEEREIIPRAAIR